MRKTLAFRIIGLSAAWIIMALAVTAVLLIFFYRDHSAAYYDEHVSMHLEELLKASQILPDGTFDLIFNPSDPRYHVMHSGWYWEVKQSGVSLRRSPSLGDYHLEWDGEVSDTSATIHEIIGPQRAKLRLRVISAQPDQMHEPLVYLASAPMSGITDGVLTYSKHIIISFVGLGIGLLLTVVLQVQVALKPLKAISTGISAIREGKASKLPRSHLQDVQYLVRELNNLLEHNAVLLKRARNRLGDLAHSVKNPLSVINNEARNMEPEQQDLILRQTHDISKSVDHYLSRARTFGTGKVLGSRSDVKAVVEDLTFAMQRLHQDRNLAIDCLELEGCWFRGEAQDLEEMTGNLLDNACKWAKSQVLIHYGTEDEYIVLTIEDDGPGISENEFESVIKRGRRLDENKPGHGQGLGIVKDIADLYGGSVQFGRSRLGGLQVRLVLPAA